MPQVEPLKDECLVITPTLKGEKKRTRDEETDNQRIVRHKPNEDPPHPQQESRNMEIIEISTTPGASAPRNEGMSYFESKHKAEHYFNAKTIFSQSDPFRLWVKSPSKHETAIF